MLVDADLVLRFRTIVRYSSEEERDGILRYLDRMTERVHAYDNGEKRNTLVVDFPTEQIRARFDQNLGAIISYVNDDGA